MYIDINAIYFVLAVLGCIAILYLIFTLKNLNEFIKNIMNLISSNSQNITTTINRLPEVADNFSEISDNLKDVTEVITDTTADFILAKESVKSNVEIATDILKIVKGVVSK
ncbi:hypothetical protein ANS017_14820 [Paraclostridium bifermentans]|uniref:ANIS5 family metal-binding protein n=1 Tax=Paraclostridium bifermentans TaxID=1490 RepID=UPI0021C395D1|nr:ANIS5 family metal-binding protein [Paraclostridium bifermentans]GKZ04938.1 hypothetical protein ANS014_33720 [Paraclostridium bifermentans]GKZ08212.1 hypothetical protein ANS015_30950 [Paraclostridium bifermentans]GKZ10098.1 hypothetical protein ANS017_14820 [Paraclostridium bifermentans]